MLKIYRSRASPREGDRLEAWLYRIARRALIDYYRKRRPSEQLPAGLKGESKDEVSAIRDAVLVSTIRYMKELPDAYRVPLQLSELEGFSNSQDRPSPWAESYRCEIPDTPRTADAQKEAAKLLLFRIRPTRQSHRLGASQPAMLRLGGEKESASFRASRRLHEANAAELPVYAEVETQRTKL